MKVSAERRKHDSRNHSGLYVKIVSGAVVSAA